MLSKLLDGCKVKRHRKKGSENYSHTNVRGLLILVHFYNLSWEFHPLQSFAHQLRQNDYHAYPFGPDFYPRSQFHNPNCPLDVPPKDHAGTATLNMLSLTQSCLLACLHPSFPVAWKSIWGINVGAMCPQIHSSPFPCSAQHAQGR